MVKGLQDQQTALRVIASGSKDAMKAMADATKAALGVQKKELDTFNRSIDGLGKRYKDLIKQAEEFRSKGMINQANATQTLAGGVIGRIGIQASGSAGAASNERVLSDIQAMLEKALHGTGAADSKGPKPAAKGLDDPKQQTSSGWSAALQAASIGKMVAGGLGSIGGVAQGTKGIGDANAAATMQTSTRVLHELARGDVRGLVELNRERKLQGGPGSVQDEYGGRVAPWLSAVGGVGGNVAGAVANAAVLAVPGGALAKGGMMMTAGNKVAAGGGFIDSVMGAGAGLMSIFNGGIPAAEARSREQGFMNRRALDPVGEMAYDNLVGMAGQRVAAAHELQGQHFRAAGIGMSTGQDFGQSVAAASSLNRKFGMAGLMGKSTRRFSASATAAKRDAADQQAILEQSWSMPSGGQKERLRNDLAAARKAASKGDPKDGTILEAGEKGLLARTLQMKKAGFTDGMGDVMGNLMNTNSGNAQAGYKQLEDALYKGFTKGLKDPVFAEALAKGASGQLYGAGGERGAGAMAGSMDMLVNGTGGVFNSRTIANSQQGLMGLNNMGNTSYNSLLKTQEGIRAMGPNANGMKVRGVQMSSLSDLLYGSNMLTDMGVKDEERMSTASNWMRDIAGTYAGANTPELNKMLGKGGDIFSSLGKTEKGSDERKQLAQALYAANPEMFGNNYDAATSAVDMMAGIGGPAQGGKGAKAAFEEMMKGHGDRGESVVNTQTKTMFAMLKKEGVKAFADALTEGFKSVDQALIESAKMRQNPNALNFEKGGQYMITISSMSRVDGANPGTVAGKGGRDPQDPQGKL